MLTNKATQAQMDEVARTKLDAMIAGAKVKNVTKKIFALYENLLGKLL